MSENIFKSVFTVNQDSAYKNLTEKPIENDPVALYKLTPEHLINLGTNILHEYIMRQMHPNWREVIKNSVQNIVRQKSYRYRCNLKTEKNKREELCKREELYNRCVKRIENNYSHQYYDHAIEPYGALHKNELNRLLCYNLSYQHSTNYKDRIESVVGFIDSQDFYRFTYRNAMNFALYNLIKQGIIQPILKGKVFIVCAVQSSLRHDNYYHELLSLTNRSRRQIDQTIDYRSLEKSILNASIILFNSYKLNIKNHTDNLEALKEKNKMLRSRLLDNSEYTWA